MGIDYELKCTLQYVEKIGVQYKLLEAENAALKQPFGTFVEYEKMTYETISGDVTKSYDWPKFEKAIIEDRARHERNVPKIAANAALLKKLVDTLIATGIPGTSREWNGRKRKYESTTANWLELLRNAGPPVADAIFCSERAYALHVEKRKAHAAEQEKTARLAEQKAAADEEHRKKVAALIDVAKQLDMPITSTEWEVRSELRRRCQYLDLAVAGMHVRGDWNDGCGEVENALNRFNAETPEDKAIVREWVDLCSDFEDGRCFRDATHSYDVVMEKADPAVVAMWNSLGNESL